MSNVLSSTAKMWARCLTFNLCISALAAGRALSTPAPAFQLLTDYRLSPVLGVESQTPMFQWASGVDTQTAVQVAVIDSLTGSTMWNATLPGSSQQTTYGQGGDAAVPLQPSRAYEWLLNSADSSGAWSGWSAPAAFVTGAWATWTAQPVWHANTSAQFVFMRTALTLSSTGGAKLVAAYAYLTANPGLNAQEQENGKLLAAARLYMEGQLVGMGPGRPGRCGPQCPVGRGAGACYCQPEQVYDTYNVTAVLTQLAAAGQQTATVALQCYNLPNASSKVALQVVLHWSDGSNSTLSTGDGGAGGGWLAWDATAFMGAVVTGPAAALVAAQWYFQPAENYNMALEPVGWRLSSFTPDSSWSAPAVQPAFFAPLVARPTVPVAVDQGATPALVQQVAPGHIFIDMGREIQGGLRITYGDDAAAGASVIVQLGEELVPGSGTNGTPPEVLWTMRAGNTYSNQWTLRDGAQVVEHHEYMEFRYVQLLSAVVDPQCATSAPGDYHTPITISCIGQKGGYVMRSVPFASWGTPGGVCLPGARGVPGANNFTINPNCTELGVGPVIEKLCLGKGSCTFVPSDQLFGGNDPCHGVNKSLAVTVSCSVAWGEAEAEAAETAGADEDTKQQHPLPATTATAATTSAAFPVPVNISAWVVHYPAAYTTDWPWSAGSAWAGSAVGFNSSSADLNAIWQMVSYTIAATGVDMFTDSNTRQRSIICSEALSTVNLPAQYALSTEWAVQRYTLEYALNSRPVSLGWAEWQAMSVLSVWLDYYYTGDTRLITQYYGQLRNWTELVLVNVSTGLWTCPPGSRELDCQQPEVDWPTNMRDGYVMVPANTEVNAYTYAAMLKFAELAGVVGQAADAAFFNASAAALRSAMNSLLWNASCSCYVDGLTTSHAAWHATAFPLALGVPLQGPQATAAFNTVVAGSIGQPTTCVPSNVFPAAMALNALFAAAEDHGRAGVALMLCAKNNSWLQMIAQGATTAMEAWQPAEKPNLTWSHPWGAGPAFALIRWLLGVWPVEPGFAVIGVMPQLGSLTHAEGVAPTIRGPVTLAVNQTVDAGTGLPTSMSLTVTLPGNSRSHICLPLPACGAGGAVAVDGAVTQGAVQGDYACIDSVAVGTHTLSCPA